MSSYIRWENGKFVCDHPNVHTVFERSQPTKIFVVLKDGLQKEFASVQFANKFLDDLSSIEYKSGVATVDSISRISRYSVEEKITVESFEKIIDANTTLDYAWEPEDKHRASEQCFELAKRMVVDFRNWYNLQTRAGNQLRYNVSTEQLLELYLKDQQ